VAVDQDSRECGEGVSVGDMERFGWEVVTLASCQLLEGADVDVGSSS
jgi:hypothetical protein